MDGSQQQAVLDVAALDDFYSDFGEDAAEILGVFFGEADELIAAMIAAPHATDEVGRLAHRLSGGSSLLGAAALRTVASEIETVARGGGDPAPAVAAIGAIWRATRAALEAEHATRTTAAG